MLPERQGVMQMGKIKSAVITVIVALATLALFFFGVVSCDLPDGVHRYNSILANIKLGSELSGEVYTVLLPKGVITAEEYDFTVAEAGEAADEYSDTYIAAPGGVYYADKDVLGEYVSDGVADTEAEQASAFEALRADVKKDAEIIAARFATRSLTSFSVGVIGDYGIRAAVPSGYTYAGYTSLDENSRSEGLSAASYIVAYLSRGGELTLRNNGYGVSDGITSSQKADGATVTYNVLGTRLNAEDVFKSVTYYAMGGTYAVKVNLTAQGREVISEATAEISNTDSSSDTNLRFYVGETEVINLSCESALTGSSFYIGVGSEASARNYASLLNSAATGNALTFEYEYEDVIDATSAGGANTAMFLAIAALVVLVAVMVFAIARYRLLGLTFALMAMLFSGIMIAVVYLMGLTLTTIGVFTAFLTLALFAGCNFWSYEQIRKESDAGRTLQAAVKTGYKKTLSGILDLHIVLVVVSVLLALVCPGEVSVCGIILLIGTLASYILHWFTRFMWYVTMSPSRDKYKFCGFSREAFDDYE